MLTFDELLSEIKRRSPGEQLALMEELARTLRTEFVAQNESIKSLHKSETSPTNNSPKTLEELGWPPGYFESVYGSLRDTNFERPAQGEYEVRFS